MKKILFIYGFGGSPQSHFCTYIREALPKKEFEVHCPVYNQNDCAEARETLLKYVEKNNIDLIMGTSLGGFIALSLDTNVSTIVLNPCMVPSVELPALPPMMGRPKPTPELIATYKPFENKVFDKEANKDRWVLGLFGEEDDLFTTNYMERFRDCYGRANSMPGGHHGNQEAVPTIVDAIINFFVSASNADKR